MLKRILQAGSLSVLLVFVFISSCNKQGNEEVMLAYLQAHNMHNVNETMKYFHKDATIQVPGQPPLKQIRTVESWEAAIKSNIRYESYEVYGDRIIIGEIRERNNWFSHAGIPEVVYKPGTIISFKDGKILEIIKSELTEESQEAVTNMYNDFLTWAYENKREEVNRLMPGGQFAIDENNSKEWFLLLDEWQRREDL